MAFLRIHKLTEKDEIGYFAPRTWDFWRALIVCFCLCCILGHWLEMPYCWLMDRLFGIVADDYAVWTDPWYHPYWVYGCGAASMTLLSEEIRRRSEALARRAETVELSTSPRFMEYYVENMLFGG